jgi:hypothetical protein
MLLGTGVFSFAVRATDDEAEIAVATSRGAK